MSLNARVKARCQIMNNVLPAGPLKIQKQFFVVEDYDGEHMIFCVDERSRLSLVMKDTNGMNQLVLLHDILELGDGRAITALAVSQNRDLKVNLVFSVRQASGIDKLYMFGPIEPKREVWTNAEVLKQGQLSGEQYKINIRELSVGTSNDAEAGKPTFPMVHLIFKHADSTTEDVWLLEVEDSSRTWRNRNILEMPCNAHQIISLCPGNIGAYRGFLVLWAEAKTSSHPLQMRFVGYDPAEPAPALQEIIHKPPPGAELITSFENKRGLTDFLISGKGLHWLTSEDCVLGYEGGREATVVHNDLAHSDLAQLFTAQSQDVLSVWSLSKSSVASYQEYAIPEEGEPLTAITPVIPLMANKRSKCFSALQHPKLGQKLFVLDDTGSRMSMLEQSVETACWSRPVDILIPNTDQLVEFQSHTLQLRVMNRSGPVISKKIKMSSSITAELIVNGRTIRASTDGTVVQTDGAGVLTVIVMSSGLATPVLTLSNAEDNVFRKPVTVDPMTPLWTELDRVKSPADLRNLKMKDGKPFLRPGMSDADVAAAYDGLEKLKIARAELKERRYQSQSLVRRVASRIWGVLKWIGDKIAAATKWVVERIGDVWHFMVEISGKIWKFVVDNVPQAAAAMEFLLEKIADGASWVMDKFGAALGWEDILKTKNIFTNLANAGLLFAVDVLGEAEEKADTYFETTKKQVKLLRDVAFPEQLKKETIGRSSQSDKEPSEDAEWDEEEGYDDPASNFGMYHVNNAGTAIPRKGTPTARILERFGALFDAIEDLAKRLMLNLGNAMEDPTTTFEEIVNKIGWDLMEDMIEVMQKLTTGILGSVGDAILIFTDMLNENIDIPVLTPLYIRLTKGSSLTMLDLACLLMAIPTTIAYKNLTGTPPHKCQPAAEPWAQPDRYKSELDARMGRFKSVYKPSDASWTPISVPPLNCRPAKNQASASVRAFEQPAPRREGIMASVSAVNVPLPAIRPANVRVDEEPAPKQEAAATSATGTNGPLPAAQYPGGIAPKKTFLHWWVEREQRNWKEFMYGIKIMKPFLGVTKIVVKQSIYWKKTYPGMCSPVPIDEISPGTWATRFANYFMLLAQIGGIAFDVPAAVAESAKGFWDFLKYKNVGARVPIAIIGGARLFIEFFVIDSLMGVGTSSFTSKPKYLIKIVGAVAQMPYLLLMQLPAWELEGSKGYPVDIAIEEWVCGFGTIANGVCGLTEGGGTYKETAGIAALMQTAAAGVSLYRTIEDLKSGNMRSACVGLDC